MWFFAVHVYNNAHCIIGNKLFDASLSYAVATRGEEKRDIADNLLIYGETVSTII